MSDSELIQSVRLRAENAATRTDMASIAATALYPVATKDSVRLAESRFGFPLPSLLATIYMQVANGGFGPGYGIVGLPGGYTDDGNDLLGYYDQFNRPDPSEPKWQWPGFLVPICHWGCAIYTCVDAYTTNGAVFTFDPGQRDENDPMDDAFAQTHESLELWLRDWANGVRLWEQMFEKDWEDATVATNPFTGETIRFPKMRLRRRITSED